MSTNTTGLRERRSFLSRLAAGAAIVRRELTSWITRSGRRAVRHRTRSDV